MELGRTCGNIVGNHFYIQKENSLISRKERGGEGAEIRPLSTCSVFSLNDPKWLPLDEISLGRSLSPELEVIDRRHSPRHTPEGKSQG